MKALIKRILPHHLWTRVWKTKRKLEFQRMKARGDVVSKEQLVRDLTALGIQPGDLVYTFSSLRSLGLVENGPDTVIDALLEAIGPDGTLVFPTFTLIPGMKETLDSDSFVFDPETTASTVGKITDVFRMRTGARRSEHPTHSIAALGPLAQTITESHLEMGNNFGEGTPFARMLEHDVKVLGLGVNFSFITYYHVYEDFNMDKFPGVYLPQKFKSRIKRGEEIVEVEVKCHSPEYHKRRIDKTPAIESYFASVYKNEGIAHIGKVGNSTSWWVRASDAMRCLDKLYDQGVTIYRTPNLKD